MMLVIMPMYPTYAGLHKCSSAVQKGRRVPVNPITSLSKGVCWQLCQPSPPPQKKRSDTIVVLTLNYAN